MTILSRRRGTSVTVALALTMLSAWVSAEPPALVDLTWEAPSDCPSSDDIQSRVRELVQQPPVTPIAARAVVHPNGDDYTLELSTESGHRLVSGDSCAAVVDALVVILALAVDPNALVALDDNPLVAAPETPQATQPEPPEQPAQPAPVPATAPPARSPPPPERASVPPPAAPTRRFPLPEEKARVRLGVSWLALGEVGLLPAPSFGPTVLLRASSGAGALELGGSYLAAQRATVDDEPDKYGLLTWGAGHVVGCALVRGRSELFGCAGLELGQLSGVGRGVDHQQTAWAWWVAPRMAGGARVGLGRGVSLEGRVGLSVPLNRPGFGIEPYDEVFRPDRVSVRLLAGIAWH